MQLSYLSYIPFSLNFRGLPIVVSLGLVLAAAACDRKPAAVSRPSTTIPVTVTPTRVQAVQRHVTTSGTLFGDEDVLISNKVAGKVVAIYKDVGDRVSAGEPLAQLLKNDYEQDRRKAESALNESLWKLGVKEVPAADFDVNQIPAVRKAALQAENAQARHDRAKQLHDQTPPLMSDQDFADMKTALDVARASYEVEVLAAKGLVAEARTRASELDSATQALADTTIRAPRPSYAAPPAAGQLRVENETHTPAAGIPGTPEVGPSFVVVARMASVGELERAITPMFRLVADDTLKLRALVPERHVAAVKIDQRVMLNVAAYGKREFEGKVSRINPQVDPVNRTFQVEILVPNPKHELKAGGFAGARILTHREENVVFVPVESIVSFAGTHKVFTIKDDKALEHTIELGTHDKDWIEATAGIKGGEAVIVEGASKLADGVAVKLKQSPTTKVVSRE